MKLEYIGFKIRIDARRPLFVAISGAHSYGTYRNDSDLDIRAVRIPSLEWALALARDERGKETKQGKVDVTEHNLYHFLSVLLHGNGTFLENLFQEHLYEDPVFPEFKQLVLEHGLSTRFARHYHGFMRTGLKDYAKKKRIKNLLYSYRAYLAGLHFFESAQKGSLEILYNIYNLFEYASDKTRETIEQLLERYQTEADEIMPNNALARLAVQELKMAMSYFGSYNKDKQFIPSLLVDRSDLPEAPRYEPFNKWIRKELLSDV